MAKVVVLIAILCVVAFVLIEARGGRGGNSGQTRNTGRPVNNGGGRGGGGRGGGGRRKQQTTTTTTTTTTTPKTSKADEYKAQASQAFVGGAGMAVANRGVNEVLDRVPGQQTDSSDYQDNTVQKNEPTITIQYAKDDKSLTVEATGMVVFAVIIAFVLFGFVGWYCHRNQRKSARARADSIDMRSRFGRSY